MENRIRILLLAPALVLGLTLSSGCASLHWPWHRHHGMNSTTGPTVDPGFGPSAADQAANATAAAADSATPPSVIDPQIERRKIKVPKIRSQNVELGAYFGEVSIESYTAAPVVGLRFDYHITEDFFFEASAGRARAGKTSVETFGGGIKLLNDAERRFTY